MNSDKFHVSPLTTDSPAFSFFLLFRSCSPAFCTSFTRAVTLPLTTTLPSSGQTTISLRWKHTAVLCVSCVPCSTLPSSWSMTTTTASCTLCRTETWAASLCKSTVPCTKPVSMAAVWAFRSANKNRLTFLQLRLFWSSFLSVGVDFLSSDDSHNSCDTSLLIFLIVCDFSVSSLLV